MFEIFQCQYNLHFNDALYASLISNSTSRKQLRVKILKTEILNAMISNPNSIRSKNIEKKRCDSCHGSEPCGLLYATVLGFVNFVNMKNVLLFLFIKL